MRTTRSNQELAHIALRVYMAINVGMHGAVRIPKLAAFADSLRGMFASTVVPAAMVEASGYAIPVAEVVLGILLLIGWRVREVAIAGLALMAALTTGMCLLEKWDVVGIQLIYALAYCGLIYTAPRPE